MGWGGSGCGVITPDTLTPTSRSCRGNRGVIEAWAGPKEGCAVESLALEHDREGQTPVLRLRGELDRLTVDEVDRTVRELAAATTSSLVLDLRDLEFIDSAGLRSLSRAHSLLAASGRTLVVRAPTPSVRRLIELVGLLDILTIEPS
jgi:anti-anti-sigma factor